MFLPLRAMWCLMPVAPGWHGRLSSSYRVSAGAGWGGEDEEQVGTWLDPCLGEHSRHYKTVWCFPFLPFFFNCVHQAFK
jgi:hypothetical protein